MHKYIMLYLYSGILQCHKKTHNTYKEHNTNYKMYEFHRHYVEQKWYILY